MQLVGDSSRVVVLRVKGEKGLKCHTYFFLMTP